MNRISKAIVAGLAALTMAAVVVLPTTPASAGGGNWHGGGRGCWVRRRVWTTGGHYLGRRLVNLCY